VEKSNLDCSSLTLELILRELIRDVNDIQERPKIFKTENYVFLRLSNALLYNKSAAVTLAFERLKYVIENNLFSKTANSIIDPLF
jgi:hypothetical protein